MEEKKELIEFEISELSVKRQCEVDGGDEMKRESESNDLKWPLKVDLFFIPEFLWVMLLYYLGLNAILNSEFINNLIVELTEFSELNELIPSVILDYNNLIMNIISEWIHFIILLTVGMFICGILLGFLPYVKWLKSKTINKYAAYGLYFSKWGYLTIVVYYTYTWFGLWYLFIILFMCIVIYYIDLYIDYIKVYSKVFLEKCSEILIELIVKIIEKYRK